MIKEVKGQEVLSFIQIYFPNFVLNNDPYEKFVCYIIDGNIVGVVSYSIIYERAELNYIAVDVKFRKQGIAGKLLNYVLNDLKDNMVENLTLEVNSDNKEAISFYFKNGFEKKAIRKRYYGNNDGYLMVRKVG